MGNPHKKMNFAGLLLVGAGIFAYVGVEGKPKLLSSRAMQTIDKKIDKILQVLEQEAVRCSKVGETGQTQPDCGQRCCCQGLYCHLQKPTYHFPFCHESLDNFNTSGKCYGISMDTKKITHDTVTSLGLSSRKCVFLALIFYSVLYSKLFS